MQGPSVEWLESEPSLHGKTFGRRQRRTLLSALEAKPARRLRGAGLAWAVLGILAGVVVTLAGVVVALTCLLMNHQAAETAAASAAAPAVTSSSQQPAESAAPQGDSILDSKGYIMPVRRVLVSPKVGGMIVKLHVREGVRVKKGDVLAELEDIDYKADFLRARRRWRRPGSSSPRPRAASPRRSARPRRRWSGRRSSSPNGRLISSGAASCTESRPCRRPNSRPRAPSSARRRNTFAPWNMPWAGRGSRSRKRWPPPTRSWKRRKPT